MILILFLVVLFQRKEIKALQEDLIRIEKEEVEMVECAVRASGLEEYNARMQEIKEERKKKILAFLEEEKKLSSGEVADRLDVSSSTALRYLRELEEEGKIIKKGTLGRFVKYKLNPSSTV